MLGSEKKKKKRIFHQCLTGTAVARDTKLKKAYKRTNGVLLCCLAPGEHFSRNNTGFFWILMLLEISKGTQTFPQDCCSLDTVLSTAGNSLLTFPFFLVQENEL